MYGLDPSELDARIRAWGAETEDPYELGLSKLYERKYPEATIQLGASLKAREDQLHKDQKVVEGDESAVKSAAFFYGMSLYERGPIQRIRRSLHAGFGNSAR